MGYDTCYGNEWGVTNQASLKIIQLPSGSLASILSTLARPTVCCINANGFVVAECATPLTILVMGKRGKVELHTSARMERQFLHSSVFWSYRRAPERIS